MCWRWSIFASRYNHHRDEGEIIDDDDAYAGLLKSISWVHVRVNLRVSMNGRDDMVC